MEKLRDIKAGLESTFGKILQNEELISGNRRKAEIPIYSFEKHNREPGTTTIYSCHVLVLEGIFALQDPRVLELLDMKVIQMVQRKVLVC